MKRQILFILLTALSFTRTASAESLAEKKANGDANARLAKAVDKTNKVCATQVSASIDFASWRVIEATGIGLGHCDLGLEQIQSICKDEDGKKAVQEKIKSYVCKFDPKSERKVALASGVLTYTADKKILLDNFVKDYLMSSL